MRIRPAHFVSFPMSLALAACAADSVVDDDLTDDELDTTAPSVVSSSPADGEAGVRADAEVVIVFSEPMDAGSVEGTLDAGALGEVELSWNAAGDTLTITPVAGLTYAEGIGIDPSGVPAQQYDVVIGTAALDRAGNPIAGGFQTIFTTLKLMSHAFELDQELTSSTTPAGGQHGYYDEIAVGDDTDKVPYRGMLSFDLATLPQGAVEIASATLSTRQLGVLGAPYASLGTAMQVEHTTFAWFTAASFDAAPLATMGTFAVSEQVVIEVDTTSAVEDDRVHRADRGSLSQYRLRFELGTDDDDTADAAIISRDLSELSVTYLHP